MMKIFAVKDAAKSKSSLFEEVCREIPLRVSARALKASQKVREAEENNYHVGPGRATDGKN